MTQHLESLSSEFISISMKGNMHFIESLINGISVGDTIDVRGPGGLLVYEGKGTFELKEDKKAAPKQVKVENVDQGTSLVEYFLLKEHLPRQNK